MSEVSIQCHLNYSGEGDTLISETQAYEEGSPIEFHTLNLSSRGNFNITIFFHFF